MYQQPIATHIYELPIGPAGYGLTVPVRVLEQIGPLNKQYLQRMNNVLANSLAENKRVAVFRFDLRLPSGSQDAYYQNYHISRFTDALNARLNATQQKKHKENRRAYNPSLRFAWVRERHTSQAPHYHFFITLNKDAYHSFGNIAYTNLRIRQNAASPSLYGMIVNAWASALSILPEDTIGLVHVPKNAVYYLNAQSNNYTEQYQAVMQRISYLAKVETKVSEGGSRSFGCSRR